jgi:hypothetical protein
VPAALRQCGCKQRKIGSVLLMLWLFLLVL